MLLRASTRIAAKGIARLSNAVKLASRYNFIYTFPKYERSTVNSRTSHLALISLSLLAAHSSLSYLEESKKKRYTMNEATVALKEKLADFRKHLKNPPPIFLRDADNNYTISARMVFSEAKGIKAVTSFMEKLYSLSEDKIPLIEVHSAKQDAQTGQALCFLLRENSGSLMIKSSKGSSSSEFIFFKEKYFEEFELDALVEAYKAMYSEPSASTRRFNDLNGAFQGNNPQNLISGFADYLGKSNDAAKKGSDPFSVLADLGADVYYADNTDEKLDWDSMAGFDEIKEKIDDTVVMPLQHPEVFEDIAKATRCRYESNRPRAILFEGPPGTGKTLAARIIASQIDLPMIHLRLDKMVSKWYGESEKNMGQILDACGELDGVLLFIDEIDALATSRDEGTSEPSRKVLSVLLQSIEGFSSTKRVTVICATNRKQDLDAALLSRFNISLQFSLPNFDTRVQIFARYAKQLSLKDRKTLAAASNAMSCRDIKEICEQTEREWAANNIRKKLNKSLPDVEAYLTCTKFRS